MTTTLHHCFSTLCQELAALGPEESQSETWLILSHVTNANRTQLLMRWKDTLSTPEIRHIQKLLRQRKKGIPLVYILGEGSFCGETIIVHKGVLIPRPETELLVYVAQSMITQDMYIFELGVGSGAIPMALSRGQALDYDGWDVSARAIRNARKNLREDTAKSLRLHHQNFFSKHAVWREKITKNTPTLLISNPPYIPVRDMYALQAEVKNHEPRRALVGGEDGLSFYRRLCRQYLAPIHANKRYMAMEVGIHQKDALDAILQKYPGYTWTWHDDFEGIPRVVAVSPIGDTAN